MPSPRSPGLPRPAAGQGTRPPCPRRRPGQNRGGDGATAACQGGRPQPAVSRRQLPACDPAHSLFLSVCGRQVCFSDSPRRARVLLQSLRPAARGLRLRSLQVRRPGRTRGPRCGGLAERTRGLKVPAGRAPLADWSPSEAAAPSQAFLSFPPQVPRPAQLKSTSPGSPAPKRRLTLFPSPRETCEGWDGRLDATSLASVSRSSEPRAAPRSAAPAPSGFPPKECLCGGGPRAGSGAEGEWLLRTLVALGFSEGAAGCGRADPGLAELSE